MCIELHANVFRTCESRVSEVLTNRSRTCSLFLNSYWSSSIGQRTRIAFELHNASMNETRLYVAAKRPNAPSRPILAVSIAAPFSRTVNSDRTEPRGK